MTLDREKDNMKRTIGITLGALALVITASAAFADDQPATTPATTPVTDQSAPATTTEKAPKAHHHMKSMAKHSMVDLNTASKEDLTKLPGISDDVADKIIAARPFKSRSELVSKKLVNKAEYKKLHSWVMASKSASTEETKTTGESK
jgi:DNA uptake protein ComE-like DNA-binding protein